MDMTEIVTEPSNDAPSESPTTSLRERVEVVRDWGREGVFFVGELQYTSMEPAPEDTWKGRRGGYEDFLHAAKEREAPFLFLVEFYFDSEELSCARAYLRYVRGEARETLTQAIVECESRLGELCSVMIVAPGCGSEMSPWSHLMMWDWEPWYVSIREACNAYLAQADDLEDAYV